MPCAYIGLVPLHAGYVAQPQNGWPALRTPFATRCTIEVPQAGQTGGGVSACTEGLPSNQLCHQRAAADRSVARKKLRAPVDIG
jgi:hypothetical protein